MTRWAALIAALLAASPAAAQCLGFQCPPGVLGARTSGDTPGATLVVSPANPTGTASAVGLMMGFGGQATITPKSTGKVLVTMSGAVGNALSTATTTLYLYTGTGTAPANGAAVTGTQRTTTLTTRFVCNGCYTPYSTTFLVANAALGTPLWIDAALKSDGTNIGSIVSNFITVAEIVP